MSSPAKKWAPPASKVASPAVKAGGGAATPGSKDAPATPLAKSSSSKWSDRNSKVQDKVVEVVAQPQEAPAAPAAPEPAAVVEEPKVEVAEPQPVEGGVAGDVVTAPSGESSPTPTPTGDTPAVAESPATTTTPFVELAAVDTLTASPPEPLVISSPPLGTGSSNSSSPPSGSDSTTTPVSSPRRETPRRRQAGPPAEDLLRHLLPGKAPPPPPPIVVSPPGEGGGRPGTYPATPSAVTKTTLHAMALEMTSSSSIDPLLDAVPGSPLSAVVPSSPNFAVAQFHMKPYGGSSGGGGGGRVSSSSSSKQPLELQQEQYLRLQQQQLEVQQQQQQQQQQQPSPVTAPYQPPSTPHPVITSSAVSGVMGRLATSHLASHGSKSPQAPVQDLLSRARTLLMGSPTSQALLSGSGSGGGSSPKSPAFVAGEGLSGEGHRDFVPRVGSLGGAGSPLSPSLAFLSPQQVEAAVTSSEAASTNPSRAGSPVFGSGGSGGGGAGGGAFEVGGGLNSLLLTAAHSSGAEEGEGEREKEGGSPFDHTVVYNPQGSPPSNASSPHSPSSLNPAVKMFIRSEPGPQGQEPQQFREEGDAALADSAWQHSQGAPHSPSHHSHNHSHHQVNHSNHHHSSRLLVRHHHHHHHTHAHGGASAGSSSSTSSGGGSGRANRATNSSSPTSLPHPRNPTTSSPFVTALVSKDFELATRLLEGTDVPAMSVGSPLGLKGPHGEPLVHLAASRATPPSLLEAIVGRVRDAAFGGQQHSFIHPLGVQHDGLLPLHVALLVGAPLDTIRYLLKAYPVAATVEVDRGLSPLACALMGKAPVEVVRLILGVGDEDAAEGRSTTQPQQFKPVRMGDWVFHPLFLALRLASPPDVIATLLAAWPESPSHTALSHPYLYPLHFAALFCPHAIAPLLLRHPEAAKVTPSKAIDGVPPGIPLHLHLSSGLASVGTIVELVKAFPESASMASTLMVAFKAHLPAEQVLALTRGSPTRM